VLLAYLVEMPWLNRSCPDWVVISFVYLFSSSTLALQRAQPDLVQDLLAAAGFADHPDHKTEHGGAAVEQNHPWQPYRVALGGSRGFVAGDLAGLLEAGLLEAACFAPRPTRLEPAASESG